MTTTIYGYSDDLVEVDGDVVTEFYTDEQDSVTMWLSNYEGQGVFVTMTYGEAGTWTASVELAFEDEPIPWPITLTTNPSLSRCSVVVLVESDGAISVEAVE